ncbi:MAG: hypothetical protein LC723_13455 [Actinobacteria bacterium]|nr:hypothetical protein [Actinomycetota bacterium]
MALSLESQGRVRQKAREFIKQPGIFYTLKAVFLYLSIYNKNSDLQLVVLDPATIRGTNGQVVADAPARVYAVWGKKGASATAAYLQLHNSTTTGDTITNAKVILPFQAANEDELYFNPTGLTFAAGVAAKSATAVNGSTGSAADADAPTGFVILGA